jgi:hypothetical protein
MVLISRRNILSLGVAASAAAFLPPLFSPSVFGEPADLANLKAGELLTVAPVSDPSSAAAVESLFPGLLSDSDFRQLRPLAFLVSNISTKPIRAFSSHWTVRTSNGGYEWNRMHYFYPRGRVGHDGMHWGMKGNRTRVTGNVPIIKAGTTRLVTPFFNWSSSFFNKSDKHNWSKLLMRRPDIVVPKLANADTTITMRVDGAITEDYASVGPRDVDLARTFFVTRNAERDEGVAVLNRISNGASPEQVGDYLRRSSEVDSDMGPTLSTYYSVRQRQAEVLLRRFERAPWDRFLATLEYLRNQPTSPSYPTEKS